MTKERTVKLMKKECEKDDKGKKGEQDGKGKKVETDEKGKKGEKDDKEKKVETDEKGNKGSRAGKVRGRKKEQLQYP